MNRTLSIRAAAVLNPGDPPDTGFVPPLARRRLSPLQKIFFALAKSVGGGSGDEETVFASRNGEDTLTRRIVEDFHADGSVSPNRFSTSVYNAAPGLWSVQTKNRAAYTAIAAGDDTVECGLLEALLEPAKPKLLIVAEETGGGTGAAVRFGDGGGRAVVLGDGDAAAAPVSLADFRSFLVGERHALCGRWLSLRDLS